MIADTSNSTIEPYPLLQQQPRRLIDIICAIPAQAGIQGTFSKKAIHLEKLSLYIPAFAGMMEHCANPSSFPCGRESSRLGGRVVAFESGASLDSGLRRNDEKCAQCAFRSGLRSLETLGTRRLR